MKKEDLIDIIVEKSGVSRKDADAVLKAFIRATADTLSKEGKMQITGLGSFKVCTRKNCINPKTKEKIDRPVKYVTFTQSQGLRDKLNG